jgi:hypothetical protein
VDYWLYSHEVCTDCVDRADGALRRETPDHLCPVQGESVVSNTVERGAGRGSSLRDVPGLFEFPKRGPNNEVLLRLEQTREANDFPLVQRGVLEKEENRAVWKLLCVLVMRVLMAWRSEFRQVMDTVRTGYRKNNKERQHSVEGMETDRIPSPLTRVKQDGSTIVM